MPDSERKQKMISLRLSEEEYEGLNTHYRAHGVRNISEFARLAIQRIVAEPAGPEHAVAARLSELDQRLRQVESQVSLLLEHEKVMS
jgi:Arc/MetJ-type ribon-helix-helix transcriptional regulator